MDASTRSLVERMEPMMTNQSDNPEILNYATPITDRVRVPFWVGRRLGWIAWMIAFSPVAAVFIVHPLASFPHATFYCCGGLLAIGIFVGILGLVLDERNALALLAILLNAFLFAAMTYVYPWSFVDR
jgi:hypothetical protein